MNFDVINALILGADDRMKVEFVPMTTDGTVGRGVLFEVRVIDPGKKHINYHLSCLYI